MANWKSLVIVTAIAFLAGEAAAGELRLTNMSGKGISAIFVTAKGSELPSEINLLQGAAIAMEETGAVAVAMGEDQCIFDLQIQFDDSSTLDRPDMDLCQVSEIIVE